MRRLVTSTIAIAAATAATALIAFSQVPAEPEPEPAPVSEQAPTPAPDPAPPLPPRDLDDDQLAAGLVPANSIGLPSPPELLYILSKRGSPKWRKLYLSVLQGQESDRTKTAMRLGLSIAEAHLAAMARDAQKIRDVTNDLQRYANVLGIRELFTESARDINSLAESKAWAIVAFELESLVSETSAVLRAQRDADLADLVTTALWVRLIHVSSSIVTEKDFPDTSVAVSSHWTIEQILALHAASEHPDVMSMRDQLSKISRLWAPEKKALGHKFDDALIEGTHARLSNILHLFTR